jgi:DNA-binding transcriptional LysR family regulator
MDRFEAMRVFVEVVDQRGFSAASRMLRLPLSTVSRRIGELEDILGAQLLVRTTRRVEVTDSGWQYYQDAIRILDAVEDQERRATGEFQRPKGHLVITSPTMFGRRIMLPIVTDFMRLHGDITVRLQFTNAVVDLMSEHVDLGIRIGRLTDTSLIAKQAGVVREMVCAGPDYLMARGSPGMPADISAHRCITYSRSDAPKEWGFRSPDGRVLRTPVDGALSLNSVEGVVRAAKFGAGLAMVYAYQVAREIADGELEVVLRDYEIEPLPVSFIYPRGRLIPQKVRAFIDFALPRLQDNLDAIAVRCSG